MLKNETFCVGSIELANVITHGGTFHADDIFSTALLQHIFLKKEKNLYVYRTNLLIETVPPGMLVYDIGEGEFDHHQKGGNGTRENGVPYASFGLLWKKFGLEIVDNNMKAWTIVDKQLVQGIDAIDNGYAPKNTEKYTVMSISSVVSSFSPCWDDDITPDEAFLRAVKYASVILDNVLKNAFSIVRAEVVVEKAINESRDHIMVLKRFAPWQYHLLNSRNPKAKEVWFVIFPSNRVGYNVQAVPVTIGDFENRKSLPLSWRGLKPFDLKRVTGVKTANFCHSSGFIAGAFDFDGTIDMARQAVISDE